VKLSQSARIQLEDFRSSTTDKKLFVRISVIIMLSEGYEMSDIKSCLGISISSIKRYKKYYKDSGIEGLEKCYFVGKQCELTDEEIKILKSELDDQLYISSQEIADLIFKNFDKKYSLSGVRKLIKRLGYVYKKTKLVPGKSDLVAQEQMVKELSKLNEELTESEALYFVDGTHPTHNTAPCYGWIKKGEEFPLPTNTGRKRLNINGAINIGNETKVHVDYTDSVNAQSTIRLLRQILDANKNKSKVFIVSDNARYYQCRVLK
jgi:transposase